MPETPVHVTEHRLAVYRDADGNLYILDCPELKGPIFGPRLLATIGWLKSMAHCSYWTIEAWMEDVLRVPGSRGYPSTGHHRCMEVGQSAPPCYLPYSCTT